MELFKQITMAQDKKQLEIKYNLMINNSKTTSMQFKTKL